MDDKTRILILKILLVTAVANTLIAQAALRRVLRDYKKLHNTATINFKAVQAFVDHCEKAGQTQIMQDVWSEIEFDWVVKDVDL
jgi:hypothetical protein